MSKYWSNKPSSPLQVSKTKGPNPFVEWLKGEPHFNKTRFRMTVLFLAVLFLFTFVRMGFAPLPLSETQYSYSELGLPVFEFTKPVQGVAQMFDVIGQLGSGILGTIHLNSRPSQLFLITYKSTLQDNNIFYVLVYGLLEKDASQFNDFPVYPGTTYFRIYAVGYTEYNAFDQFALSPYMNYIDRLIANTDCLKFTMGTSQMKGYNVYTLTDPSIVVGLGAKLDGYIVQSIKPLVNFDIPNLTFID